MTPSDHPNPETPATPDEVSTEIAVEQAHVDRVYDELVHQGAHPALDGPLGDAGLAGDHDVGRPRCEQGEDRRVTPVQPRGPGPPGRSADPPHGLDQLGE